MNNIHASLLRSCRLCARNCGLDRVLGETGPCRAGMLPRVARWVSHMGEEPPLSGQHGSGTIFFSGCSMRCIFCQNASISQGMQGSEVSLEDLAGIMLELQSKACHNVNLVSPTHYVPQISLALDLARHRGLVVPVVYNTHGYDSLEALECMSGKVDIYLADMKYSDDSVARELSGVHGYCEANRRALREMFAQVGHLEEDPESEIGLRGLLVRILVLPEGMEGAKASLAYLEREFSADLAVSLMAQYAPLHKARNRPPLNRTLRREEYDEVVEFALHLGFQRLWLQEIESAFLGIPDFSAEDPFEF